VNRQHPDAEPGHAFHAFGNGIVDVEKLEVQEDVGSLCRQIPRQFEAARIGQAVTDLVEIDHALKGANGLLRIRDAWQIEPDDESRAGQYSVLAERSLARSMSVVQTRSIIFCVRSSLRLP
jgi:hypothetical protein